MMSGEHPVVYLVDDDDALRASLARVLASEGYLVEDYGSVVEFLLVPRKSRRSCLVLDVQLPGGPSGLDLQRALTSRRESLPIIFVTGNADVPTSVRAIKGGAFDFLCKPLEPEILLDAVRAALASQDAAIAASTRRMDLVEKLKSLSASEHEVFQRVIRGEMNKNIAVDLLCSERTIKTRRAQVMEKMGAESLADLVGIARELE